MINSDTLKPPNPSCAVCGVIQSRLVIDPSRATLRNLVEDVLKDQLQYGDELSVNNEVGILYDPDLDDNLSKKFSDLGIKADSFLTVVDEEDDNPRVNLSFSIAEKYVDVARCYKIVLILKNYRILPEDSNPVVIPEKLQIPRKPNDNATPNADDQPNGTIITNGAITKRKRSLDDPGDDPVKSEKRGKVFAATKDFDPIVLDDSGNGAIVVEDD